jgi:transcription-repair coupling factor (superfamily II helicase)
MLVQSDRSFKLAGPDKLAWKRESQTLGQRVSAVRELFRRLKPEPR